MNKQVLENWNMKASENEPEDDSVADPSDDIQDPKSVLQKIGAALVTFVILYMLLGIPAYLLFRGFFGE